MARREAGILLVAAVVALAASPFGLAFPGVTAHPPITPVRTSVHAPPGPSLPVAAPGRSSLGHARPTSTVPPNVLVSTACENGSNAEVEQAWDPSVGYLYEEWIGCNGIGFARSTNGGLSFQAAFTVPGSANASAWDPSIAVAHNGTVYAAYMRNDGNGDAPAVAWSWDHGQSFAGWHQVGGANTTEFGDRDFIAVAPNGTLYLTWDYSPNAALDQIGCAFGGSCYFIEGDYNIELTRSTNGGLSWSRPVPVDPEYPNGGAVAAPLVVEPSGAVDILYEDYQITNATNHTLGLGYNYFTRSTDGGRTFSSRVLVGAAPMANDFWWIDGALALSGSGALYATYDGISAGHDNAYLSVSSNNGSTWSNGTVLNPDRGSAFHIQVAAAPLSSGEVVATYLANNSTPVGWRLFAELLASNGTPMTPPFPVSASLGDPPDWPGDTLGITAIATTVVAVAWSYGLNQSGSPVGSQVYEARLVVGAPSAPQITEVVPGVAQATVDWSFPANETVDGFLVAWGPDATPSHNVTVGPTASSAVIAPLQAFQLYRIVVFAYTATTLGSPSAPRNLTLTAWGILEGIVSPSTANVTVDLAPVADPGGHFLLNTTTGPHSLNVSAVGYVGFAQVETLPWNATAWANVTLPRASVVIEGTVRPIGAHVTWDGSSVTMSLGGNFSVPALAGSSHTIEALLGGYATQERNVTAPESGPLWENFTLAYANGTVIVQVDPTTASVTLAGVALPINGSGGATVVRPPGNYSLNASAPGYAPVSTTVTVHPAGTTRVPVHLSALPKSQGSSYGPFPLWVWGLVGIAVGAAVALGVGWSRRRHRTPPDAPVEPGEAEPSPTP